MAEYLQLIFAMVFVQNFVLSKFLGLCPFIGVSKKRDAALGMGLAVIFVMTLASIVTMVVYKLILGNPELEHLRMTKFLDIVSFILVIASLVQFVEIVMRKVAPALYKTLGIYLPLITTNCAILGATQIAALDYGALPFPEALLKATLLGIGAGLGFTLALFLMAGLRERLETAPVPASLQGVPIAFLCAAAMALAFLGFQGFV